MAHLLEILQRDGFAAQSELPMTIGQAKRVIEDSIKKQDN
jgi:hypothetical protein